MNELPIQKLFVDAIAVVDRERIPYAIMGGFAVRSWGVPRPTYDADLAIVADRASVVRLLNALAIAGFEVPDDHLKGFIDSVAGIGKVKVTRFVERTVWEIDLFLARGPFLESAMQRRRHVTLGDQTVWVLAPEDLILLKLIAHRRKDQLDVEEILKIARDLDVAYLRRWAVRYRSSIA